MAIGLIVRFPEAAGQAEYDAVSAEMDIKGNPPDGGIFHVAGTVDGQFQLFDIWESREHYDRFAEERLIPAQKTVMGEEAFSQLPDADITETTIHYYNYTG